MKNYIGSIPSILLTLLLALTSFADQVVKKEKPPVSTSSRKVAQSTVDTGIKEGDYELIGGAEARCNGTWGDLFDLRYVYDQEDRETTMVLGERFIFPAIDKPSYQDKIDDNCYFSAITKVVNKADRKEVSQYRKKVCKKNLAGKIKEIRVFDRANVLRLENNELTFIYIDHKLNPDGTRKKGEDADTFKCVYTPHLDTRGGR